MSEVFITKARLGNIASLVSYQISEDDIRDFYKKELLSYFSTPELNKLTAVKIILDSIENQSLRIKIIDVYKNAKERLESYKKTSDSRWIYLGSKPAYHGNRNCIHLNSTYDNYEIPVEIPKDKIEEYRAFFLDPENKDCYINNRVAFFGRVEFKFNVIIKNIKEVHIDNSGEEAINMMDGDNNQILEKIHQTIDEMNKYKIESIDVGNIISKTGFNTKAALKNPLFNNEQSIIKTWDEYKSKLKDLIIQHLTIEIAPDYKFDHQFLEDLGFRKCSKCF
ncbi:hypothetical protein J9253_01130 [Thiothrix litoralis]|jgi:hypothetical protein|uniref:Uncharacterized protein n=1 Tax=Thiothrix litoralis TaxID=2891210 RepID=A0ABX7WU97_9GAMM|nr:hypothetical protein [Thiothrix litoralis]QTR46592.1 hypothetical protein J9253_01130 [Thiothrix litoralis]